MRTFPKVSNLLSFSSSNPSERQLVTQSPVLCCSRTLNVVPGIHSRLRAPGCPRAGKSAKGKVPGRSWGPGDHLTRSLVPTRSLSHPVSKQMKDVGVGQGQKTRRNHVKMRPRTRRREGPLPPAQVRPQQTWEAGIRFHHHFLAGMNWGSGDLGCLGKLCLSAFSREGSRLSGLYSEKSL